MKSSKKVGYTFIKELNMIEFFIINIIVEFKVGEVDQISWLNFRQRAGYLIKCQLKLDSSQFFLLD